MYNGPLEVASEAHARGILPHEHGVLTSEVESSLPFEPLLVRPGDAVLFDSYLPHRSGPNTSSSWRRSAYLTYNPAAEGNLHDAYYARKRRAMLEGTAGTISINKDFGGRIVSA